MDESDGESADDVLSRPAFATTSSNSGSVIPVQLADECSHVIHNTQGYVNGITSFTQDSNNWVGIELTMNENGFVRDEEICNEMADWNGGASLSTITSQPRAIPPHEPSTPVAPASSYFCQHCINGTLEVTENSVTSTCSNMSGNEN